MKRAITVSVLVAGFGHSASAQAPWQDDFDGYPLGTILNNVGGWTGWDNNAAFAGIVSDSVCQSDPHSIRVDPLAGGPVQEFSGLTSGQWRITFLQFIPSTLTMDKANIVINTIYEVNGPKAWSVQMVCPSRGNVYDNLRPEANQIDVVYDRWVEIHFEIDLDSDTLDTFYNGTLLSTGQYAIAGGPTEIANINFWTGEYATTSVYYDDVRLESACYADCDVSTGAGVLDIFDFLCFQNSFVNGEPYACDCDSSGPLVCDIFDFLCFQDSFVAGCP